jgi:hypothetical protein
MTRQSQADLKARLIHIGRARIDIGTPVERYLSQAYMEMTAIYPFRQFQQVVNAVGLATGESQVLLSAIGTDVRYLMGVRLNEFPRRLRKWSDTQYDNRELRTGTPMHYMLYGQTLYFDAIADKDYTLRVRWVRWPVATDFASATPLETPDQWDDVVVYLAATKLLTEYLEPDRAAVYQGMADSLISSLPTEEYVEDLDYDQGWKPAMR